MHFVDGMLTGLPCNMAGILFFVFGMGIGTLIKGEIDSRRRAQEILAPYKRLRIRR